MRTSRATARGPRLPLGLALLGLALFACGDEAAPPAPPRAPAPDAETANLPSTPTCIDGAVETCREMLGEHDGIVSCFEGTRTCWGGSFGPCVDGLTFEVTRSESSGGSIPGLRTLAFSAPSDCSDNPCNSYCMEFDEAPPAGLVPDEDTSAPPLSSWTTGNVSDYPAEWVVVGAHEPCQVAGDCQFNTACSDPSLGSCTHSVCDGGEPLVTGCNRCADAVCALAPDCCGNPVVCAHDACEVGSGAALDPSCDSCVAAVCTTHPECCDDDSGWDAACVGYVATECAPLGKSCGCPDGSVELSGTCFAAGEETRDWYSSRDACSSFGLGWSLMVVDDAAENAVATGLVSASGLESAWLDGAETGVDEWTWQSRGELFFISDADGGALQSGYTFAGWADGEPELGLSDHGIALGVDGAWRDAPLTFELGYVCEGPKNRLGPQEESATWDAECVALAQQTCGVSCPDAAAGTGACTPRVPAALDQTCASFDLALGATCEASGLPQIPVCNHGQAEAPAGLRLSFVPVEEIGALVPDLTTAGECVLAEPIPPGRCVTVSDCPSLTADSALVVNPIADGDADAECRRDDNWTIYQPLSCRPAVCESGVHDAARVQAAGCAIELENSLTIDAALARVSVGDGVPEPTCGENEIRWGASCYFFSTDVETWDAAQQRCQARGTGWDLVALNSPAEKDWVHDQSDPALDLQIGLNDKLTEGSHVWSNGSCSAFTAWAGGQPNNSPPGSEQCVRMTAATGASWEDTACNDGASPYACEGPVIDARGACASGQIMGPDGKCYVFQSGGRAYDAARTACTALGPGWRLASIKDEAANDFVTGVVGCSETWLHNPPGEYAHWAPAESIDLSKPPYIDELGFWHADGSSSVRATLCQGPPTATGAPELVQVASASACTNADQFYFVGNTTAPETLRLCPAACDAAAAVDGRRIELEIPCAPPSQPALETEHTQIYDPECPGTLPQWDFFYYDAVTPADSRVEFEVRTAASADELASGATSFLPVAEAHALPTDTQRCESVARDGSACPVDLFTALGDAGRLQQVNLLQLRVRLIPGSSGEGPIVRDWKVRFSCPPAQ